MHNTFSTPSKQGEVGNTAFVSLWMSCLAFAMLVFVVLSLLLGVN
jgi:hypothetical protein